MLRIKRGRLQTAWCDAGKWGTSQEDTGRCQTATGLQKYVCRRSYRHGGDSLGDGRVGVHPVLVVQVDRVDAQPLQRARAGLPVWHMGDACT